MDSVKKSKAFSSSRLNVGTIKNFASMSDTLLEKMKNELGLFMTLQNLCFCRDYYKKFEKNDPVIEEIRLLDRIIEKNYYDPSSVSVGNVLTNDKEIMQSYSDLMSKMRALNRTELYGYTLESIADCISQYIKNNLGENTLPKDISCAGGSFGKSELIVNGYEEQITIGMNDDSGALLYIGNKKSDSKYPSKLSAVIESGDVVSVISPDKFQNYFGFVSSLGDFLFDKAVSAAIKCVLPIEKDGVIGALLSLSDGMKIDSLYDSGEDALELCELCDFAIGGVAVLFKEKNFELLKKEAEKNMLDFYKIATVNNSKRYTFRRHKKSPVSLESEFLKSLKFSSPRTFKIDTMQNGEAIGEVRPYCFSQKDNKNQTLCVDDGKLLVSASSSNFNSDDFQAAICATVSAAAKLIAAGANRHSIGIYPNYFITSSLFDEHLLGASLATILGVYRAQAELLLNGVGKKLEACSVSPFVSVFGIAEFNIKIKNGFFKEGSKIYYLKAGVAESGLPNFENMRNLFSYVSALAAKGKILSARAVEDSLEATLCAMSSDVYSFSADNKICKSVLNEFSIGSFVIESDEDIDGLLLGYTTVASENFEQKISEQEKELPEKLDSVSAFCALKPSVCLPIFRGGSDPSYINGIFEKFGAVCHIVPMKNDSNGKISETSCRRFAEMLNISNVVFLEGDAAQALESKSVLLALNAFLDRDGTVVVNGNDYGINGAIQFSDYTPEKIIKAVVNYYTQSKNA